MIWGRLTGRQPHWAENGGMRIELRTDGRVEGDRKAGASAGIAMVFRIMLLVPGVFLTLNALAVYPLLDSRAVMGLMLGGFLVPAGLQIASFVRNGAGNFEQTLRWTFVCASLALVLLGLSLFANGALDRSSASEEKTTVLEKGVIEGRYGARQNHLFVASWRPDISREDLSVTADVFAHVAVGMQLSVEVHKGYFGLSWYGRIVP